MRVRAFRHDRRPAHHSGSPHARDRREGVRLRRALRGVGMPFDVIVMRTDRFEETKNVVGGIAYPANKYGRVIYKAASRGGSVTGRLRRPSRMPRSSRPTAWSIATVSYTH